MRTLLLLCLIFLTVTDAHSQQGNAGGGVYLALGVESSHSPGLSQSLTVSRAGVYAEWLRPVVHPGLDVRAAGGGLGVLGTLVGPRASFSVAGFHPYVEALFGPNHADFVPAPGAAASVDRQGVTAQAVAGVDADLTEHLRWRVLEWNQSSFSGIANSHPWALTTGIVLHLR